MNESQTNFKETVTGDCKSQHLKMDRQHQPDPKYRSGTVNSNTVNSKFHLIRSCCEYLARFLSFHV